jgi:pimeloyl-ACP methyl ester carboxylesterase
MLHAETIELVSGRQQVIYRDGEGPPLLWLHGPSGLDADDAFLRGLTDRRAVIAPLAPGYNDVRELDELLDVHDLALHYDDILQAVGLDRLPVIGHSFGAMIAAELAAHFPDRVSQLILISPLGLWNDSHPVADLFAVPYPELGKLLYADPQAAGGMPSLTTESGERDVERLVAFAQGMTAVAKFLWPIPDTGLRRRLPRVRAHTLVIFGERDALVPAHYAGEFAAAIAHARSEVVPGAGHMVHLERTDVVSQLAMDFLAESLNPA